MRPFLLIVTLLLGLAAPARADFEAGVSAYERGDYRAAYGEFLPLALAGMPDAQFNLGVMYHNGWGVPQDDAEAARWFREAAEAGLSQALYFLGAMHDFGRGAPQDDFEAVKWYRMAAEQGDPDSQFGLGLIYSKPGGVLQDHVLAYMWFVVAAANLPPGEVGQAAVEVANELARLMTPEQIAEAQKRAREWKPKSE